MLGRAGGPGVGVVVGPLGVVGAVEATDVVGGVCEGGGGFGFDTIPVATADWDIDGVRDDLRGYALGELGDQLVINAS